MKSRELLSVGLRVCGVLLIFLGLRTISNQYMSLGMLSYNGDERIQVYAVVTVIEIALIFLLALALLKFPNLVAKKLLPRESDDKVEFSKNGKELLSIAFCLMGVYILSWAIPDLVNNGMWLIHFSERAYASDSNYAETVIVQITTVVEIVIGGFLCFGASGLGNVLWKLRGMQRA
ncbi:hypothetical protein [Microbulbifer yueqingensis]|uniref:Uncharacterized protein n=1 Tax=Microbulbifer yueqingensis TaxID=658219 RepID=A0A1G8WR85_9GAMM|nr:hypothetical protein [Microbulbifer yueqingensis]SDJ80711.1 hypothetical protein SAMN05216212_0825 [Microbulbifer yueqingensis]